MQKIDPAEVKNVLPNITSYDRTMAPLHSISPINGIIHSIASLQQFVDDFNNDICPKLATPPAGFSWQVGIYPMIDANNGNRPGLYFIPTMVKDGWETMKPGDPNASKIILDYRVETNRSNYNSGIVYIEDLGTSWP